MAAKCYALFADADSGMFYFTPSSQTDLIARKMELHDNVIPASNSAMARVLNTLGQLTGNTTYLASARQMLNNVAEDMPSYGAGYSNWGILALQQAKPYYEVVAVGEKAFDYVAEMEQEYKPNALYAAAKNNTPLEVFKGRLKVGETLLYVCQNNSCLAPVATPSQALPLLT